jgi:hypothetical protein
MKPHPFIFALAVSLFPLPAVHAADADPGKDEPAPYKLKRRSSFTPPTADARAPFWPIGWVPKKTMIASTPAAQAAAPTPLLDEKAFRVTSILLGAGTAPSLAVINGRAYGEGEFVKVPRGSVAPAVAGKPAAPAVARIRVQRISDGSVVLQCAEQAITISMQRQELALRKVQEEQLIPEDR